MRQGCPYGSHRVLEPVGSLPQAAWKVDHTRPIYDNEMLIDVTTLNVDAASFRQFKETAEANVGAGKEKLEAEVGRLLMEVVNTRGKLQNPVTGSGGMLLGQVAELGEKVQGRDGLKVGDRLATLVSLTLTPLAIDEIKAVRLDADQVDITGHAIIFASGVVAPLTGDVGERLALAVLDVAGAPAQTARLVQPGDTVFIVGGGGKSGMMCTAMAREAAGVTGNVISMGHSDASCQRLAELDAADIILQGDATNALETMRQLEAATGGEKADVTINCVNIPDTEMTSILCTKPGGTIYFFSMATSFTRAALGAEGVGSGATMIVGNGYAPGHARVALNMLKTHAKLAEILTRMYL